MSIIRPKQPNLTSYPAAAQKTSPTSMSETSIGAAKTTQQIMIISNVSNISICSV